MHISTMELLIVCLMLLTGLTEAQYLEELAGNKPTRQYGIQTYIYEDSVLDGNSSFSVDLKPVTGPNQTCSSTARSFAPWWMVDLQDAYLIKEVAIYPRPRMSPFWDDSTGQMVNPTLCYKNDDRLHNGTRTVLSCVKPLMSRYVKISMFPRRRRRSLCLCELEVFGLTTVLTDNALPEGPEVSLDDPELYSSWDL